MTYEFNANFSEFKKNITPKREQIGLLTDARKIVRAHIRKTFSEKPQKYFSEEVVRILSSVTPQDKGSKHIFPRFMTQGSFAYNTLNYPDKPPEQQMDLDFGVYFPLTHVADITDRNFRQAAIVLRGIVAGCIQELVKKHPGWLFAKKGKCLRVIVAKDAHIDLPIYSIPDKKFKTILEKSVLQARRASSIVDYDSAEDVLLATDNGWIKSDPRVIHEWVVNSKENHGNNFLLYSRYIKAWRDHQEENSSLSSILIMGAVCKALEDINDSLQDNVALELETIVRKFSFYLGKGGVTNPDPAVDENLDENLDDKPEICKQLIAFANKLNQATKTGDVNILIATFGTRFPNQTGFSSAGKVGTGAASILITAPPVIDSAPVIKQSGAVWKSHESH